MDWFEETLHRGFRSRLGIDRIIHETKTEHQHLIIFDNPEFGRVLALDGVVQTTERDEFIYHEMLAHTPVFAHGAARNVLIIGGGDGGMLEEVLKHRSVEAAVQVEIDDTVVELSKQHLRSICGEAYEDPRTEVVIADGVEFVNDTDRKFDVIIVDSTDPIGPGEVLFGRRFYGGCKRCLAEGGILVTQNGVPFVQGEELSGTLSVFRELFKSVTCYRASVPAYIGGDMTFGWGSDDIRCADVPLDILRERFKDSGIETNYYTPDVHRGAFALPPYISRLFE
ncbi:MAG: polyamine aminopropyltransferase [Alphaproteobacteria bacterium]|nr:polyamine aminopropyltransferase [Alphaproteobacteria bacterium]